MTSPRVGFLIDIDGVVLRGDELVPGADAAVDWLRGQGHAFRFLTNTSRKPRRAVVDSLRRAGLEVDTDEVISTTFVAAGWLHARGLSRIHFLVTEETLEDFEGFEVTTSSPEAVVVGDMGRGFTFEVLNRGFLSLEGGAELVALQKNRWWTTDEGLMMDAGAFVAALEYASSRDATVIGKPSRAYFDAALEALGLPAHEVFMIGDDVETDIGGAKNAGLRTILVKTGKYRGGPTATEPDHVLESLAEIREIG